MTVRSLLSVLVLLVATLGVAAPAGASAPAGTQASPERAEPRCVTKSFTKKAKFKKAAKVTIKHTATGCTQAGTGPNGPCAYLASYSFKVSSKITTAKGVKTTQSWRALEEFPGQTYVHCDGTNLLGTSQSFGGRFTLKSAKKTYLATPVVGVQIDADLPGLVRMYASGAWKFYR